jgi:hypothetical protein
MELMTDPQGLRSTTALPAHVSRKFVRELARLPARQGQPDTSIVTASELAQLPSTVQRFFDFMQVVNRPRVASFQVHLHGRFRMRPSAPWMKCEAWQYDARDSVRRVFHMRMRMFGVVPVYVRDTYIDGRGRMSGRLFDRLPIVDVSDEKISTGELATYLNDAILSAPSILLGREVRWSEVDRQSFDVELTDGGRTVSGRVSLDARGAATNFSTHCRFGEDPAHPGAMVQTRWSTPISGFTTIDGRVVAKGGSAIWHFPSGDFNYADLSIASGGVAFNV